MNTSPQVHVQTSEPSRRQAAIYRAARAHSRRVAILKFALPVVALAGLAWLGTNLVSSFGAAGITDVSIETTTLRDGAVVMQNPELTGVTSGNRPYRLVAQQAIQSMGDTGQITMTTMEAVFAMPDGTDAKLISPQGAFFRTENRLELTGDSQFTTADGVSVDFKAAEINVDTGEFVTDQPVRIIRQGTTIDAGSMRVEGSGDTVVFERDVRLVIEAGALPKPAPAATEQIQ